MRVQGCCQDRASTCVAAHLLDVMSFVEDDDAALRVQLRCFPHIRVENVIVGTYDDVLVGGSGLRKEVGTSTKLTNFLS